MCMVDGEDRSFGMVLEGSEMKRLAEEVERLEATK